MTRWQLKSNMDGRVYFPLTTARIKRWIREGRVNEDYLVWRSDFSSWKKAGETEEFGPIFEELEAEERF